MAIQFSWTVILAVGFVTLTFKDQRCLGLQVYDHPSDHVTDLVQNCPCMARDQCPRVYGQSASDIRQLGFLKPCQDFGTVRCCGVSVSISTSAETVADLNSGEVPAVNSEPKTIVTSVPVTPNSQYSRFVPTLQKNIRVGESSSFYQKNNYERILSKEKRKYPRLPHSSHPQQPSYGNPKNPPSHDGLSLSNPSDLQVAHTTQETPLVPPTYYSFDKVEVPADTGSEIAKESRIHATIVENDRATSSDKSNEGNEALTNNLRPRNVSRVTGGSPGNKPAFKPERKRYRQRIRTSTTTTTTTSTTTPAPYAPEDGLPEKNTPAASSGSNSQEPTSQYSLGESFDKEMPVRVSLRVENPNQPTPTSSHVASTLDDTLIASNQHLRGNPVEVSNQGGYFRNSSPPRRFNPSSLSSPTVPKSTFVFPPYKTSNVQLVVTPAVPSPPSDPTLNNSQVLSGSGPKETLLGNSPGWMAMNVDTPRVELDTPQNAYVLKPNEQTPFEKHNDQNLPTVQPSKPPAFEDTQHALPELEKPGRNPGAHIASSFGRPYKVLNRQRTSTAAPLLANNNHSAHQTKNSNASSASPAQQSHKYEQKYEQPSGNSGPSPSQSHSQGISLSDSKGLWRPKSNSSRRFPVPHSFGIFTKSNVADNKNTNASDHHKENKETRTHVRLSPAQYAQFPASTLPPAVMPQRLSTGNRVVVNASTDVRSNGAGGEENQGNKSNGHFIPNYVENPTVADYTVREGSKKQENNQINHVQTPQRYTLPSVIKEIPAPTSLPPVSLTPVLQVSLVQAPPLQSAPIALNSHKFPAEHNNDHKYQAHGAQAHVNGGREPRPILPAQTAPPAPNPLEPGRQASSQMSSNPGGFSFSFSTLPGGATIYHHQPPQNPFPSQPNTVEPSTTVVGREQSRPYSMPAPVPSEGGKVIFPTSKPSPLIQPGNSLAPSQPFPPKPLLPQTLLSQQSPQQSQLNALPPKQPQSSLPGNYKPPGLQSQPPRPLSPVQGGSPTKNEHYFRPSNAPFSSNPMSRPISAETNLAQASEPQHYHALPPYQHYKQQVENTPQFAPPRQPYQQQPYQQQQQQQQPPQAQPGQQQPVQQHLSLTQSIINRLKNSMRTSRGLNFTLPAEQNDRENEVIPLT